MVGLLSVILSYKSVATLSSIIAAFLAMAYLVFPSCVLVLFDVPQSSSAHFMSGRAAILFAGLGMIYWFTRDTQHRPTRIAVMKSSAIAMAAMLIFGAWQMARGFAGPSHLVASAVEALYLCAFLFVWRQEARNRPSSP